MTTTNGSNEIQLTRVYDAPLNLVWDAWTDPAQVAQWWGPRGFTITTHHKDLRTGGSWNYTMHGPDGTNYENTTKYLEVVDHAKLVYDHGGHVDRPPLFRVTALFSEVPGGKTKMDLTFVLATPEIAAETRKFIKKAGGESTWDRLAEYLEKNVSGTEIFVLARTFEAPIKKLFELWTTPTHMAEWVPPTGFTMEFINVDIRPGGGSFYLMSNPAGVKMYGKTHYIAVDKPHRVVYTQQFADEKGNVSRHPMAPTWPETMLTEIQFFAETENRTRVVITWRPHGSPTPQELDTFVKARGGMTQGWTGSLDKLEDYLTTA